jgi:hypothetical protein
MICREIKLDLESFERDGRGRNRVVEGKDVNKGGEIVLKF